MLEKVIESFEENKKFYLSGLLAVSTGVLDCILTSQGLKDSVGTEFNFYYQNLYNSLGGSGLYLGKFLLLTALIPISKKEGKTWPMNAASIVNSIGAGSWILVYNL